MEWTSHPRAARDGLSPQRPQRASLLMAGAVGALIGVLVLSVYRQAVLSHFFNDDFHWLADARRFTWIDLLRLERYDHFYRPVVLVYFHLGQRLVGCTPWPFHAASIGLHLVNTSLLLLFARTVTGSAVLAAVAALLFCVQPGYVEAVVWVGAITDLLPATWFLLALWLHLVFLRRGSRWAYLGALTAFVVCLGTHETAVTILPMLIALDALVAGPARPADMAPWLRARVPRYLPYAVPLLGFLVIAYVVNSRSYLVRESHYAFGWHAVENLFDYVAWLYVGRRRLTWHVGVGLVLAAIAWRGTPRLRFYLAWMFVTLLPVAFFTWGTASRYLYVPAAGFALLMTDLVLHGAARAAQWLPARVVRVGTALLVAFLVARFATFAVGGVREFRERTEPYARLIAAVRHAGLTGTFPGEVRVRSADVADVPALYLDPAAETALCRAGVHVVVD